VILGGMGFEYGQHTGVAWPLRVGGEVVMCHATNIRKTAQLFAFQTSDRCAFQILGKLHLSENGAHNFH
jgi:hypothetical protein